MYGHMKMMAADFSRSDIFNTFKIYFQGQICTDRTKPALK